MNQLFYGSLNVTELLENLKKQHSGFMKAQNGKIYANIRVWLNDSEDKYGNVMSVQLSSKEGRKDAEGKIYLGNLKRSDPIEKPITSKDIDNLTQPIDDLPF